MCSNRGFTAATVCCFCSLSKIGDDLQRVGVCVPDYAFTSIKSRIQHNAGKKAAEAAAGSSSAAVASSAGQSSRKRKIDFALERVAAKRAAMETTINKVLVVTPSGCVFQQCD